MNIVEPIVQEPSRQLPRWPDDAEIDARIQREIDASIFFHSRQSRDQISHRLGELDSEWSIERVLEMKASALAFFGVVFGLLGRRRWLVLPGIILPFLFQHALEGTCGPFKILRRFGLRSQREIERERYALKALRGDFKDIAAGSEPDAVSAAGGA